MKYYSQYRSHDLFELQESLSRLSRLNRWVKLAAAAFNFKRAMRLLLCFIERVILWCCGGRELNSHHQFFPQVYMKNTMSSF